MGSTNRNTIIHIVQLLVIVALLLSACQEGTKTVVDKRIETHSNQIGDQLAVETTTYFLSIKRCSGSTPTPETCDTYEKVATKWEFEKFESGDLYSP